MTPARRWPLASRLVLALALLALATFGSACASTQAAEAPPKPETVVSLTFDDGHEGQYQLRQVFKDFGVRGTFYLNSETMGIWPRMSWEEAENLARDGNDIGGHTLTHAKLTQVSPAEAMRQVCEDRENLQERGFDPVSFAYPFGAFDATAEKAVEDCGYATGRTFTEGAPPVQGIETLPPADAFATETVVAVRPETTVAQMRGYVEEAEENDGGWVQFVFHGVCRWGWSCDAAADGPEVVSLDTMVEFLEWLEGRQSAGTVVKTVREAVGLGTLQAPGAPSGAKATPTGAKSVAVSWTAPSSGGPARSYTVTPYLAGFVPVTALAVEGVPLATSAVVTGLSPGYPYTFRVKASNVMGTSANSAASGFATPQNAAAPAAPENLVARPATDSLLLEWTAPFTEPETPVTKYTVTPYLGEAALTPIQVEGSETSLLLDELEDGGSYSFKVSATNSVGTGPASAKSSAVTPRATIFDFETPGIGDLGESLPVELGVKFRSTAPGLVTGIRYFKSAGNTGTASGSLWTTGGERLAQVSFSKETASGWQSATFSEPVAIEANTTYIASYFNPGGHFPTTNAAFGSGAVTNGSLSALASSTPGSNGVYSYGSTSSFPDEPAWNSRNYFVDVLFAAGEGEAEPSAPEAPESVVARPASGSVLLEWAEPFSDPETPITDYTVTPYLGEEALEAIEVDGEETSLLVDDLANGGAYSFEITATNSVGTGPASKRSAAVAPRATLFDFEVPGVLDVGDSEPVELGMKFRSALAGEITGLRFYKSVANTGTHSASLWTTTGERLAQVTFTSETASGWQTALLSEPVEIAANTTYVASYFNPNGHFSATSAAFASGGVTNGPLHGLDNSTPGGNGVYAYGSSSSFPNEPAWNARNYFVDVMFAPGESEGPAAPAAPENLVARPATDAVLLEWSAPFTEPETPVTKYTVTPYLGEEALTPVEVEGKETSLLLDELEGGATYTFKVSATNSVGTGPASAKSPAVTPRTTIFDFVTPEISDLGESLPLELGVQFRSSVAGEVTGIRFFKTAANTGTHTGSLWNASGERLAQVTFSGESATGWQSALFSEPVAIEANTTYVASYFNPSGHFSTTNAVFGSGGVSNGTLLGLPNSTPGGNGVYAYGSSSSFPNEPAWNARNYFVDVLFAAGS